MLQLIQAFLRLRGCGCWSWERLYLAARDCIWLPETVFGCQRLYSISCQRLYLAARLRVLELGAGTGLVALAAAGRNIYIYIYIYISRPARFRV